MRNIILILCLFLSFTTKAQVVPGGIEAKDLLRFGNYQSPTPAKYRLYPTSNPFTFLRLNTTSGFIDAVQYSMSDDKRIIYSLSTYPLVDNGTIDRFTLYPTLNFYTFILLDQVEGIPYQVQWSTDSTKRYIIQIRKGE